MRQWSLATIRCLRKLFFLFHCSIDTRRPLKKGLTQKRKLRPEYWICHRTMRRPQIISATGPATGHRLSRESPNTDERPDMDNPVLELCWFDKGVCRKPKMSLLQEPLIAISHIWGDAKAVPVRGCGEILLSPEKAHFM